MKLKSLLAIPVLLLLAFSSTAQIDEAESAIQKIMEEHPVVGLSVAVVKEGKLFYTRSFGLKNIENNIPLTDESLFRIASISKSFTVTSLMQLIEKKKLKLTDDASTLMGFKVRNPRYPEKVITLEMLLSHTSGINDSQGYFTLDAIDPAKNPDWQKCYNDYEPGNGYMYCNLNFNMAGSILEKYSGERFDQYVVNHVLSPLHLKGGYNVNNLDAGSFATIYDYNVDSTKFIASPSAYALRKQEIDNYVMGYTTPVFSPTGGLKISAPDLARYMLMHMKEGKLNGTRIISRKSEQAMRKPRSDKENYGLALETTSKLIPGETLIGHTGSAYGLFSAMFFEPKKKFGIVVISNGCHPGYTDSYNTVIREVINALYNNVVKD
ncbi:MAG: serine hydrolase domain-containing protein [Ginsengibacter sp.]